MQLDNKKIYIVGNSRSGTTMLSRILGLNNKVYTFQELHFFEQMVSIDKMTSSISRKKSVAILNKLIAIEVEGFYEQKDLSVYSDESEEILDSLSLKGNKFRPIDIYEAYLIYWTKKNGKEIPCEQTPRNLFYISEIIQYFPNTKIINMIRDPRSVLLSQSRKWRRRSLGEKKMPLKEVLRVWINYHPITISRLWVSAIRVVISNNFGNNFILIKYEDLVLNPKKEIISICDFCGIKFDNKMLLVPRVGSSIGIDMPNEKGIDKNNISAWKNGGLSGTEIYIAQIVARKEMSLLGYQEESVKPNYLYLFYLYLTFPVKICFSLLLNIHRMKNITETLRKRIK